MNDEMAQMYHATMRHAEDERDEALARLQATQDALEAADRRIAELKVAGFKLKAAALIAWPFVFTSHQPDLHDALNEYDRAVRESDRTTRKSQPDA